MGDDPAWDTGRVRVLVTGAWQRVVNTSMVFYDSVPLDLVPPIPEYGNAYQIAEHMHSLVILSCQ